MSLYQGQYQPASARLPGWDYSAAGYYFVTICVYRRQSLFGEIQDGAIRLSPMGEVADWSKIHSYTQFAWQPRFYDHIIRDDQSLERIRRYIQNNPYTWDTDEENPDFHHP